MEFPLSIRQEEGWWQAFGHNVPRSAAIDQNRDRIETFHANCNNARTVTRNCKLETALNERYQGLLVSIH